MIQCTVQNCKNEHHALGLCKMHYMRTQRTGKIEKSTNWGEAPNICSVPGCCKKHHARGYCANHYQKFRKYGDPEYKRPPKKPKKCSIKGCDRVVESRGYCSRHYRRWRIYDDPLYEKPKKVCKWDGCGNRVHAHDYCRKHYFRYLKYEVIKHYGGKCECCGEDHPEFLEVDHVNGDGAEHRRKLGRNAGSGFYKYLRANNYDVGVELRVLCSNCNSAYGRYGYCPHQVEHSQRDELILEGEK